MKRFAHLRHYYRKASETEQKLLAFLKAQGIEISDQQDTKSRQVLEFFSTRK